MFLVFVQVPAAARAGAIAPCEVTVPAQNTGLGPEKTSFFQALGITTKISRGTIEILVSGPGLPVLAWPIVGAPLGGHGSVDVQVLTANCYPCSSE